MKNCLQSFLYGFIRIKINFIHWHRLLKSDLNKQSNFRHIYIFFTNLIVSPKKDYTLFYKEMSKNLESRS